MPNFRASVGHNPLVRVKRANPLNLSGQNIALSLGSGALLYFEDGFESGDFSAWTGSTGTTTVVSTDTTPDGTFYMRSILANGSNNDNGRYKEIGTAGNISNQFRSGFVQFKFSMDSFTGPWPASDQQKVMIVQYYDPVWASFSNARRKFQVIVGVAADSLSQRGQYYLQLIEWNDTTGTFVQGANVFQNLGTVGPASSFNSWDTIRLQIQLDTNGGATLGTGQGNGVLRLWVNNTLVLQHTNVNIVRSNASVGMGRLLPNSTCNPSTWQGTASSQYWDAVQVASDSSLLDAMPSSAQIRIAGSHNPDGITETSTVLRSISADTSVASDFFNGETPGVIVTHNSAYGYGGGGYRAQPDPIGPNSLNEIRAGLFNIGGTGWGGAASYLPFNTYHILSISVLLKMTGDLLDLIAESPGTFWDHHNKVVDFACYGSGGGFTPGEGASRNSFQFGSNIPQWFISSGSGGPHSPSGIDWRTYANTWVWLCFVIDNRGATAAQRYHSLYAKPEGGSVFRVHRVFGNELIPPANVPLQSYPGFGIAGFWDPIFGFWDDMQDRNSFSAAQLTKLSNAFLYYDQLKIMPGYPNQANGPPF